MVLHERSTSHPPAGGGRPARQARGSTPLPGIAISSSAVCLARARIRTPSCIPVRLRGFTFRVPRFDPSERRRASRRPSRGEVAVRHEFAPVLAEAIPTPCLNRPIPCRVPAIPGEEARPRRGSAIGCLRQDEAILAPPPDSCTCSRSASVGARSEFATASCSRAARARGWARAFTRCARPLRRAAHPCRPAVNRWAAG
jgi:hypothetical protein